jgi:hypothetical protein
MKSKNPAVFRILRFHAASQAEHVVLSTADAGEALAAAAAQAPDPGHFIWLQAEPLKPAAGKRRTSARKRSNR